MALPRLASVTATTVLIASLSACSTTADRAEPSSTSRPSTPELAAPEHHFQQVAQLGRGRAITVAASDRATIVATTIGVDIVQPDAIVSISTALRPPFDDVLVTADTSTALLIDEHGAGELWSLDDMRLLRSIDGIISARFADDEDHVDVVTTGSLDRLSTLDGAFLATTAHTVGQPGAGEPEATHVVAWFGPKAHSLVIAAAGGDQHAEVWDGAVASGVSVPAGAGRIGRAVGDPTGERVVLGMEGDGRFAGSLVGIDTTTGEQRWAQQIGDDAVESLWDVGHDGRTLVVADMNAQLIGVDGDVENSWTVDGLESVASVVSLGSSPGYAIVRARGSMQFVGADGTPGVAIDSTGKRLVDASAAVTQPGLVAVDADGRVLQWTTTGALVAEIDDYVAGRVNQVAVAPDGASGAAASTDGSVTTFDLRSPAAVGSLQRQFIHDEGNVDSVAFAPRGDAIVSGVSEANGTNSFDDTLSRWDIDSDDRRFAVGGIPEPIMGCTEFRNTVLFSPDGEFFVAPFHDFSVSLRDAEDGSVIHEFPEHLSIVWGLAISADGQVLATSSDDWTTRLWSLDDFGLIAEIEAPPGGFLDLAFTPDGTSLVVSDISGRMHRLDVASGSLSSPFDGESTPGSRMSVSPDGRYVAAGTRDEGTISVWEVATGRIVQQLVGHGATVTSVVFTPDGRGLISGSADGTVRVWQVESMV